MTPSQKVIRGYFDANDRIIIGLKLGNGEFVSGQIDTGFNGLLLFSYAHALELGVGVPPEYDGMIGPGGTMFEAGKIETSFFWFGELRLGVVLVSAPIRAGLAPRRGTLDERQPLVLLGTRLLHGCHLSVGFRSGIRFPVKIKKY